MTRKKILFRVIFAILLAAIVTWIVVTNTTVGVTTYTISSHRIDPVFDGYTIAQISDFHNACFGENNSDLLAMLQKENPDLIVITGDFIDSYHTDYRNTSDFANAVTAIAPTYYVSGNHEKRIDNYGKLQQLLIAAGVYILDNTSVWIQKGDASFCLAGLQDPSFTGRSTEKTDKLLRSILPEEPAFTVLLSHRPELFPQYVNSQADLVLTGHAHGGQVRLPFIGGLLAPDQGFFPKYDAGLFQCENTTMIVSRGLAARFFTPRINNQPELVIIKLASISEN